MPTAFVLFFAFFLHFHGAIEGIAQFFALYLDYCEYELAPINLQPNVVDGEDVTDDACQLKHTPEAHADGARGDMVSPAEWLGDGEAYDAPDEQIGDVVHRLVDCLSPSSAEVELVTFSLLFGDGFALAHIRFAATEP